MFTRARVGLGVVFGSAVAGALFTGTNFPQPLPRINSQVVTVVPVELNRIFADALRGLRLYGRLEHRQLAGFWFHRLSSFTPSFAALFIAERARACITQIGERIARKMSVFPFNVHTFA
jgi:hypothetical protein